MVSPDGSFVYELGNGSLAVINTATRQVTTTNLGISGYPGSVAISPDGHYIYSLGAYAISVISV